MTSRIPVWTSRTVTVSTGFGGRTPGTLTRWVVNRFRVYIWWFPRLLLRSYGRWWSWDRVVGLRTSNGVDRMVLDTDTCGISPLTPVRTGWTVPGGVTGSCGGIPDSPRGGLDDGDYRYDRRTPGLLPGRSDGGDREWVWVDSSTFDRTGRTVWVTIVVTNGGSSDSQQGGTDNSSEYWCARRVSGS